jgi:hypothetical protein
MTPRLTLGLLTWLFAAVLWPARAEEAAPARPPVRVTIRDDKPVVVEVALPIEPVQRITYHFAGQPMAFGLLVDGKRINYQTPGGIQTTFKIDERIIQPGLAPGRLEVNRAPLPPHLGKKRIGEQAVYVFENVRFTQTVEVVPGKPSARYEPGQKRRLDTVLVRYFLENKDNRPHTIALRVFMDVLLVDNDGALFAAPNFPNKILDGIMLKDKQVPDYLQVLQRPDLKNPGYVAHFTYALGRQRERPSRVVLTGLRAFNQWEMQALQAGGDSAMAMFWDAKTLPPGSKRELAYSYGQGIASNPENEGRVEVALGGSFEPGKLFSVTAYVEDPQPGQALALELPPGMERLEGKEWQPVPAPSASGNSIVLWKARVRRTGEFALRVRSSTGVTQTKLITISRANGSGR